MKTNQVFWIGLLLYAASFCLVALGETKSSPGNQPLFGFACAFVALVYPWLEAKLVLLHNVPAKFGPFFFLCLVVSGWINPVFLVAALLGLTGIRPGLFAALRVVLVSMLPFSWILAFYYLLTYPREGHFLWIMGMLLVLYSDKLARTPASSPVGREISV